MGSKGIIIQTAHQCIPRTKDEEMFASIMEEIDEARSNLILTDDGLAYLSTTEVASFSIEGLSSLRGLTITDEEPLTSKRTQRIVIGNLAQDQTLQINSPIGQDEWNEIRHTRVEGNIARGNALQVNWQISRED